MKKYDVTLIGIGRLGGALALTLSEKGYSVNQLVGRNRQKTETVAKFIHPRPQVLSENEFADINAEIVFITVQDSELPSVANRLAESIEHLPYIFHTCGSISSSILKPLADYGCQTGSIHPLISVNDPLTANKNFKNGYFCLEGAEGAVHLAKHIVADLGGKYFTVDPNNKSLYHAAAVTTAGHAVALFSTAVEMLSHCGLSEPDAKKVLLPLLATVAGNLSESSPAEALTGTFARADVETMKKHIHSLKNYGAKEVTEIYKVLGLRSLTLAEKQGADKTKLAEMREILEKEIP